MTTSFRDSLVADVELADSGDYLYSIDGEGIADAILRSPEMQSIKMGLRRMALRIPYETERDVLIMFGLPDHVIEWVLS